MRGLLFATALAVSAALAAPAAAAPIEISG